MRLRSTGGSSGARRQRRWTSTSRPNASRSRSGPGLVSGLRNIAVEASFDVTLRGPLSRLATDLNLQSDAGSVVGAFVLNTTVPGSHGTGAVEVGRLNLARWLNRPNRPSDISGRVAFDLDLELGRRGGFPRGPYTFEGSHAGFMTYRPTTSARAAGSPRPRRSSPRRRPSPMARASGSTPAQSASPRRIGTGSGATHGRSTFEDCRRHSGSPRRQSPGVRLRRRRAALPRRISPAAPPSPIRNSSAPGCGSGTYGSIDTSAQPVHYTGEGPVAGIDLQRFAHELDIGWLNDPRYAGTVSGRFYVDGFGFDPTTMTLSGGGRLARAELFDGTLSEADVSIEIAGGSLIGMYDGAVDGVTRRWRSRTKPSRRR